MFKIFRSVRSLPTLLYILVSKKHSQTINARLVSPPKIRSRFLLCLCLIFVCFLSLFTWQIFIVVWKLVSLSVLWCYTSMKSWIGYHTLQSVCLWRELWLGFIWCIIFSLLNIDHINLSLLTNFYLYFSQSWSPKLLRKNLFPNHFDTKWKIKVISNLY